MDTAMGGRVAEELVYGADKVTTGASSDLQQATRVATAMVMVNGMSEKVGLRSFSDLEISSAQREVIDSEIRRLLQVNGIKNCGISLLGYKCYPYIITTR